MKGMKEEERRKLSFFTLGSMQLLFQKRKDNFRQSSDEEDGDTGKKGALSSLRKERSKKWLLQRQGEGEEAMQQYNVELLVAWGESIHLIRRTKYSSSPEKYDFQSGQVSIVSPICHRF